jgi:uncharacterized protein (DUF1800 family)
MPFDSARAEIRFGCGLSPRIAPVRSIEEMIERLNGPDHAAQRFVIPDYDTFKPRIVSYNELKRARRKMKTEQEKRAAAEEIKVLRRAARGEEASWLGQSLLRRALSEDGFRERLVAFWADHFTAASQVGGLMNFAQAPYIEQVIRPNVAGRFPDMLRAVATQPFMLSYLDQHTSIGPGSRIALTKRKGKGLNENLAREMFELHTLGVGGPYSQHDVRQLAELLTGLSYDAKMGFRYKTGWAEPGPETVLGVSYGGKTGKLDDVLMAFDDLARHPATAAHLARKLVVHFVSDDPDQALVDHITQQFTETDGDLVAVYTAMLEHPAAWDASKGNVKPPIEFVGSALRALDIVPRQMPVGSLKKMRDTMLTPMALMGQQWARPLGPDGWPEVDAEWITPQRLAARLQWAMTVPVLIRRVLPDPREFVQTALGNTAPQRVRFAASAAENRVEGVGLTLASPAFQRT